MNSKTSLPDELKKYLAAGWPLIPLWGAKESGECLCGKDGCDKLAGKHPRINNWPEDASKDKEIVNGWVEKYPLANWGILCGKKSGIVVIDVDCHGTVNGMPKWKRLMKWAKKHNETPIKTLTVHTPHMGLHFYFKYPAGDIKLPSKLDEGIDVKSDGGYVLAPPSVIRDPYTFATTGDTPGLNTPIQEMPAWLLEMLQKRAGGKPITLRQSGGVGHTAGSRSLGKREMEENVALAFRYLKALKQSRCDSYSGWEGVGMALQEGCGDAGLDIWDSWSQKSFKYQPGACAQKWVTFNPSKRDGITYASLIHWAEEDKDSPNVRNAPQHAKPSDYRAALEAMGYKFRLNEMNDSIYLNGTMFRKTIDGRMSDVYKAKVLNDLRECGYKAENIAEDCFDEMGLEHSFHPIKEYLNGLVWNEQDNIGELAGYFTDKDGVFPELLQSWLVGAVDRIIGKRPGEQHPMLVLDGKQGLGKSRFVHWLGSALPPFYMSNAIRTDWSERDFLIELCSKFVWEVVELDSTLRKADVGALKAFLSREVIDVRKQYGTHPVQKPATASFIGTINNSGGFLADPTGSRRFRVCTLTDIKWKYDRLDVNQVWAHAVALLKKGKTSELSKAMNEKMLEINNRYERDEPIAYDILENFTIDEDPSHSQKYTAAAQILHTLREKNLVGGSSDQQIYNSIGSVLTHFKCENILVRVNGRPCHAWKGVYPKNGGDE